MAQATEQMRCSKMVPSSVSGEQVGSYIFVTELQRPSTVNVLISLQLSFGLLRFFLDLLVLLCMHVYGIHHEDLVITVQNYMVVSFYLHQKPGRSN